jgi:hypothetical protein
VPSELIDASERIGHQLRFWYISNASTLSVYELDVSGRITNIATLLASQREWNRATAMLELAKDVSKRDWRPFVRLAVMQLKRRLNQDLWQTINAIDGMMMEDSLKQELLDYEYDSYVTLFAQIKRQMPKFPLLSLPSDLFCSALSEFRFE